MNYIQEFKVDYSLIVLCSNKRNLNQIKKIDTSNLGKYPFSAFKFINQEIIWFLKTLYVKFILKNKKYNSLVIGNLNNILGYFLAVSFDKQEKPVYVLDDGLATLNIYLERNRKKKQIGSHVIAGKLMKLLMGIFKIKRDYTFDHLYFYTSYDLECLQENLYDTIILASNDFLSLSMKYKGSNEVWFIGSPVVEQDILDLKTYKRLISNIKESVEKEDEIFIYILHRAEKKKINGINYRRFDKPLESVFLNLDYLPSSVISFYSTALINLASYYPNLKCEYINITKYGSTMENLEDVYSLMTAHINLKEYIVKNDVH